MPWKYVTPSDSDSQRNRDATIARMAAWWEAFAEKLPEIEANLTGDASRDLKAWMDEHLAKVHPRLRWEFGHDLTGRTLIITCEAAHFLRPMTETLLRRAPQVAGWSFRQYRPTAEPEEIPTLVRARTGHIMGSTTVQAKMGDHRRLDLVFQSLLAGSNESAALEVARAAGEYLLGEDIIERWIGDISVVELTHTLTQSFIPLPRVRSMALEQITIAMANLPDRPYWKMPAIAQTETKYRPEKRDDYANQDDAVFGMSILPELRPAGFATGFCSCRFSRQGETFCFLKIDASDVDLDARYKRKKTIEAALDAQLREDGTGAVVGTATGRRYVYLDLAVVDVVKAFEGIRRRLLALELLPTNSWLLFYDAELAGEYIGMRSSTPQPPMWKEPTEPVAKKAVIPGVPPPRDPSPEDGLDSPMWMVDPIG